MTCTSVRAAGSAVGASAPNDASPRTPLDPWPTLPYAGHRGPGGLLYKIAATRAEREAAFRLVHASYLESGLTADNASGMRVTPYHLLPTTEIFVALADDERGLPTVAATVTLVIDGEEGLPMECIYAPEVAAQRQRGVKLAELTCFADRRRDVRRFLSTFCELNRFMAQFARRRGIDQLLAVVHPRHAKFYMRYAGFRPIGGESAYPAVQGQPAIPLALDFHELDENPSPCYRRVFAEPLPLGALLTSPMPEADRAYFASCIDPNRTLTSPCTPGA